MPGRDSLLYRDAGEQGHRLLLMVLPLPFRLPKTSPRQVYWSPLIQTRVSTFCVEEAWAAPASPQPQGEGLQQWDHGQAEGGQGSKLACSIAGTGWRLLHASWSPRPSNTVGRWWASIDGCPPARGAQPAESPWQEELSIREWHCPSCGTLHDRDISAAVNKLAPGWRRG